MKEAKKHGARYPWKNWFSTRGELTLVRGVDFHCTTYGMLRNVQNSAARHERKVSVHIGEGCVVIKVHR